MSARRIAGREIEIERRTRSSHSWKGGGGVVTQHAGTQAHYSIGICGSAPGLFANATMYEVLGVCLC